LSARTVKVARETATLDRLSGGRLTLGVGLGSDHYGAELTKTGEQRDDHLPAQLLDEALEIPADAWSGKPVHHLGEHYTVDDIQFPPRPVQQPGVPVWVAGHPGNVKPLRRAAGHDGCFPIDLEHSDQLAEIVTAITDLRQHNHSVVRHRGCPAARNRPGAVRHGWRHLVDAGAHAGSIAGDGA
jgi:alkanesulfonate monooxygenase SsuD/methylene tetrahydromethanopterin reductase-like flavin-dependent oxidoreductase (luciferase family)